MRQFQLTLMAVSLALAGLAGGAAVARAADGAQIFHQDCAVCHDTAPGKNKLGPSLAGVVGRKSGSLPGYIYSPAMKKAGLTWTEKTLDIYLINPRHLVPGTKMLFLGIKNPGDRHAVIQYLASLKD